MQNVPIINCCLAPKPSGFGSALLTGFTLPTDCPMLPSTEQAVEQESGARLMACGPLGSEAQGGIWFCEDQGEYMESRFGKLYSACCFSVVPWCISNTRHPANLSIIDLPQVVCTSNPRIEEGQPGVTPIPPLPVSTCVRECTNRQAPDLSTDGGRAPHKLAENTSV